MWKKICLLVLALQATKAAHLSNPNYHYPSPPPDKALHEVPVPVPQGQVQAQSQARYATQSSYQPIQQPQHQPQPHAQPQPQLQQPQLQRPVSRNYPAPRQTSIARQFSAPALESAAFTMALRSQGLGGSDAAAGNGHSKTVELRSLNIKLPVPLGITPINAAPLPIQSGSPYAKLHGVTSYGTTYPQR